MVRLESGVTLSIAATGDLSAPPVVFLPGPTDSWRSYEPVLGRLPGSLRAIAVSQRGHGDSDKPATGYAVEDFAGDVPLLLDALGIGRAIVVGHSGSCLVARRVAIEHPERVAGLVLEASPSTLRGHIALGHFVEAVVGDLQDPIEAGFARSFVVDTSSERLSPELVDMLAAELMKVPVHVWKEMFAGLVAYDDLTAIERITAPTLLLWGDADTVIDREMQTVLAERVRRAELRVYHGVGHTPRWEDPGRFVLDVASFTDRWLEPPS